MDNPPAFGSGPSRFHPSMSNTSDYEYGVQKEEHQGALEETLNLSFGISDYQAWRSSAGDELLRTVYRQGQFHGCVLPVPMGQWFGGRSVPMIGAAAVAVAIEHRGRGAASFLMRRFVHEMHGEGWPISTLHPASWGLYRRAGYEPAGSFFRYTIPMARLPLQPREPAFRPFHADDQKALEAAYTQAVHHRNGFLDRSPVMWKRACSSHLGPFNGFVLPGPDGLQAFVFFKALPGNSGEWNLELSCYGAVDGESSRRLLSFLAQQQTQLQNVKFYGGPQEPMLETLDFRYFQAKLNENWMVRLIHLPKAMASRGWPLGLQADLHFQVEDDLIQENNGAFRLQISGGEGRWIAGGEGRIQVSVPDMAPLYTSFHSATSLAQQGRLQAPPEDLARLDAAFAGPAPGMAEEF
ncbi:MAG: GNAT family N-acetyltransferase [Planctomycetota bacterium]|nr:MAG: GNAT family N-acetyltransferase [Planctomycetota bacterium]